MFEGDFAETCDEKFPLVSMGGLVSSETGVFGTYYNYG
jgi:hypothetical protein